MSTTTATPAGQLHTAETLERTEQLEAALRDTAIADIRSSIEEFLMWEPSADTLQILTLRDILLWTNSRGGNVLTGVAVVLGRSEPNAIFVSDNHATAAEQFVAALEEGVDTATDEWKRRMSLIERILTLEKHDIDSAARALDAIESDQGCGTPEEEFVTTILALYGKRLIEPKRLSNAIEELRDHLREVATDAAHFVERFPNGYDTEQEWPALPGEAASLGDHPKTGQA